MGESNESDEMKLLVRPMLRPAVLRPLRWRTDCKAWALRCLAPLMVSICWVGRGVEERRRIVVGRGLVGLEAAEGISLAPLVTDACSVEESEEGREGGDKGCSLTA